MPKPKVFQIPAILDGVSPRKDGSMTLRFVTNEITEAKDKTKLMAFFNTFGWVQFSDQSISTVPVETAHREAGSKSPSQRLRASLFVLWKQKYSDQLFDPWYEIQMNKIIDRVQEQLQ